MRCAIVAWYTQDSRQHFGLHFCSGSHVITHAQQQAIILIPLLAGKETGIIPANLAQYIRSVNDRMHESIRGAFSWER